MDGVKALHHAGPGVIASGVGDGFSPLRMSWLIAVSGNPASWSSDRSLSQGHKFNVSHGADPDFADEHDVVSKW